MTGKDRRAQALIPFLLTFFLLGGQALAQVTIKKEAPKPFKLTIEDCISATITSPEAMTVYLIGTATEAKEGLIAKVTTEKFEIKPGVNRYSAANIPPIAETWIAPKYEKLIKRTGEFPEGRYTILIKLFTEEGELLGEDKRSQEVRYPQIRLISPEDGATITEPNPLFQWSITRPISGLEYKLSIYEVMPGQIPQEATEAGMPLFEQGGIKATSLRYPVGARNFEQGKTYCWNVEALIGGYSIAKSENWLFNFGGEIAAESCQYYLDEKGRMWHSLGAMGARRVRHKPCTYVFTKDGKMYHSDGKKWKPVKADSCTYILAINGMYHFNGKTWTKVRIKKSFCIFDKKMGMMHYDGGQKWTEVPKRKCIYTLTEDGLYHCDGEQWLAEPFKKCTYILAYEGMPFATMYHFNGKTWKPIYKKCCCILAKNGMYHYAGRKEGWVRVPDSLCTYAYTDKGMYHYDGKRWSDTTFPECTYIKAYNGMFHSKGKGRWKRIKGKKCECLLAENGMYHYAGRKEGWVKVPPDSCTYAYVKRENKMYHFDGERWKPVKAERCTYIKAYNGMFHFNGRKWVGPFTPRKCIYILAKNGMFHSKGKGEWERVKGYRCQWINTYNRGWLHCDGRNWNPPKECNYRVEVIRVSRAKIRARIYHYERGRWVQIALKDIPIGRPKRCPRCTYYFEHEAPNEYILYHCEEPDQPREIARVKIPK